MDARLVVFDKEALTVSEELLGEVKSYIDEHYVEERHMKRRELLEVESMAMFEADISRLNTPLPIMTEKAMEVSDTTRASAKLEDIIGKLDEPFSATLIRLIDEKGEKDSDVYRRANIDRRLFSKIRANKHYTPSKPTVLAFAVALKLTLDQTNDLLERAGFALSHSRRFDVIVEYFIKSRKYDIFQINEVLFSYDQPLLGG
jgi:hypothetical protein